MAVRIKSITFDSTDPYRLAQFWSQLTGFIEDADNGNAPEDPEALLLSPDGQLALLFIAVPEQKRVKQSHGPPPFGNHFGQRLGQEPDRLSQSPHKQSNRQQTRTPLTDPPPRRTWTDKAGPPGQDHRSRTDRDEETSWTTTSRSKSRTERAAMTGRTTGMTHRPSR